MQKINVLKPFVLSIKAQVNQKLPTEIKFKPGVHEISEEIANHWYIREYADGCIETPEQAAARIQAAAAEAERVEKENEKSRREAEAAFRRATGASGEKKPLDMSDEKLQKELNTPVNQLQANAGKDIDAPAPAAEAVAAATPAKKGK